MATGTDAPGPYAELLGPRLAELSPALRDFHTGGQVRRAEGVFEVRCKEGRLARWLARRLGLPEPTERVPVTVEVTPTSHGEKWVRRFGDDTLETSQYARDGVLIESAGPVSFTLAVDVDAGGLRFESRCVHLASLRIPRLLAPRVTSRAEPLAGSQPGWRVCVRIAVPPWDPLLEYAGEVFP